MITKLIDKNEISIYNVFNCNNYTKEKIMGIKVLKGDATKRSSVRSLKKESIDLTVTSPPYNVGMKYNGDENTDLLSYDEYMKFTKKWLKNVYYWTVDTGRLCLNIGLDTNKGGKHPVCADITNLAMKIGWNYHSTIIWNEGNISRRTAWGSWKSASAPHVIAPVETIIVLHKGEWKRNKKGKNNISKDEFMEWVLGLWTFNGESAKRIGHEAPFPRELPKRCIKLFSYVDDTILDPFLGSGTTLIEASATERNGIGIEIEPNYCELAKKRIHKEGGFYK